MASLANKFEQWHDYLLDNINNNNNHNNNNNNRNNSSGDGYPSFPRLFNSISSIRETLFQNPTSTKEALSSNNNNNNNSGLNYTSNNNNNNSNNNQKEKRKKGDNSTTKKEKRIRRAITEEKTKHSINKGEEEEEGRGEGRLKTIVDIPNEVLATILEYLFFHYKSIPAFVELALVSKVWRQMIHFVSNQMDDRTIEQGLPNFSIERDRDIEI